MKKENENRVQGYGTKASGRIGRFAPVLMLLLLGIAVILEPVVNGDAWGGDLKSILKAGKLRHLGIPYANFVTDEKTGLDVELIQNFCAYLGVKYELVESNWQNIVADLTGKVVKPNGDDVAVTGESPVRGDIIATGFTVLPWREKVADFSNATFPTGIWLITRGDASIKPITPSGIIDQDIRAVKNKLQGISVLGLKDSCLDPDLYGLDETGAKIKLFPIGRDVDDMIPAVIARMADATLMDVPVALVALEQRPGEIKVIGPVSPSQDMACAFPKTSPLLRQKFNDFFRQFKANGRYRKLITKYYPSVFTYYPDFLKN
jgi:ABC-type amino acid transport substrate-binding protein